MNTVVRRKQTPRTHVTVSVSLDEFDEDDIRSYLREQEGEVAEASADTDGCYIDSTTCNQINTLALCGQKDEAIKLVMEIVSRAIGREIKP
jgi:hypothetical protein